MLNRDSLPLETSFGSSPTIASVANVTELLGHYYDSILKLQNEITELQNYRDNAKMMILQYEDDIEYIGNYKKQLNQQVNKVKKLIPNSDLIFAQQQSLINAQSYQQAQLQQQQLFAQQSSLTPAQAQALQAQQQEFQNAEICWDVESENPFYNKSSVSLLYMLNASSVICSVQFDPRGTVFAFSDPRYLRIVNAQNGQIICTCEMATGQSRHELHSRVIKFSPDGNFIAVGIAPHSIGIFSLAQQAMIQTLEGHQCTVSTLQFTQDSKVLISGGADGYITIWDMKTFQMTKQIQHGQLDSDATHNHEGAISSIVALANDAYFAVGFLSGMVFIYDPSFEHIVAKFAAHNDHLLSMIATPKGELVTTSADKSIKIWTLTATGAINRMTIENSHSDYVTCACCSYSSDVILTGSKDETIKAWNIEIGSHMFTAKAHKNTVLGMTHHPQLGWFASCSGDGYICVWSYQMQPE